ncbi:hypothetical protein [Streptomyces sp. JJ36]|uniref:hypothetical protein n=1 Tax=Streptomyces sp. JJ36 TaxID=2736645 RepID=UPI001F1BC0A1|nr:hypothetical protein [Streptomyces sp. JJ36]MCF6523704.1 hypothetical protein [Streptomyces sp. JJ36]
MSDTDPRTDDDPRHPRPQPIRFYGTTWVDHSGGYAARRLGLGLGALALAAAGAFVLRLAYEGLALSDVGSWANILIVVAFALCSSMAFTRTLSGFTRGPEDPQTAEDAARERSMRSILLIGFIGVLLAYALRSLVEAPGEKLHRAAYDRAVQRYERGRTTRTGNPAKRKRRR